MLSAEETHQPERKDTNHVTLNGGSSSLPMKKRKSESEAIESSNPSPEQTLSGHENQDAHNDTSQNEGSEPPSKSKSPSRMSNSRVLRLAQNRKAARESRRKKKMMIEELQRSTMFFSTANQGLKQQNNELARRLLDARAEVAKLGEPVAPPDSKLVKLPEKTEHYQAFPPEGAPASTSKAQQVTGSSPLAGLPALASNLTSPVATCSQGFPAMQPGSTMQAMENFQQAATAAMQAAAQGMQCAELAKLLGEPVAPLDSKLVKLLQTTEYNQPFPPEGASASTSEAQQVTGSAPLAGPPAVVSNLTPSVATCSQVSPVMQPGSTMQAMANFQQAANAEMQAAAHGMQALGVLTGETATASHAAQLSQSTGSSDGQTQKPSLVAIV